MQQLEPILNQLRKINEYSIIVTNNKIDSDTEPKTSKFLFWLAVCLQDDADKYFQDIRLFYEKIGNKNNLNIFYNEAKELHNKISYNLKWIIPEGKNKLLRADGLGSDKTLDLDYSENSLQNFDDAINYMLETYYTSCELQKYQIKRMKGNNICEDEMEMLKLFCDQLHDTEENVFSVISDFSKYIKDEKEASRIYGQAMVISRGEWESMCIFHEIVHALSFYNIHVVQ